MANRRQFITAVISGLAGVGLAGCSGLESDSSSSPTETDSPTATETPTDSPTATTEPVETSSDVADMDLDNQTDTTRTLSLTVSPDRGEESTDSWTLGTTSTTRIETYPPLDSAATLTAAVDGYETVTYERGGDEPGNSLSIQITPDEVTFDEIIR